MGSSIGGGYDAEDGEDGEVMSDEENDNDGNEEEAGDLG